MIEIALGSENPTKLQAVRSAFKECLTDEYRVRGYAAASGVTDQPMSDEEMVLGARNRAEQAAILAPEARYTVGMEGGVRVMREGWFNMGWICIKEASTGIYGYGVTLAHRIPDQVRHLMEDKGLELSNAVSEVYGTNTVADRDCSGVITANLLPAAQIYQLGVIAAFTDLHPV